MGILDYVNHSSQRTGIRAVISGVEKVGKTTLACSAPRTLLVPLEQGFASVSINKTPMLEAFSDVLTLLDEIITKCQQKQFPYQTLAFDSATALERLIHDAVLRSDPQFIKGNKKALTMEAALGGYGKAYQYANELFAQFLARCDYLAVNHAINIILTCHVFAAKVIDPTAGEYDTWDLLLHSPKNQKSCRCGFCQARVPAADPGRGPLPVQAHGLQGRVRGGASAHGCRLSGQDWRTV